MNIHEAKILESFRDGFMAPKTGDYVTYLKADGVYGEAFDQGEKFFNENHAVELRDIEDKLRALQTRLISLFETVHAYNNTASPLKCDICGNHPFALIQTGKGTFCTEHAQY